MNTITHTQRYLPHELSTKFHAVKLYRQGHSILFVCRRYHISKSSLMRWNKRFDGTKQPLMNRSRRPLSPHPNSHTPQELKWICDFHRVNPHISLCELYGKLRSQKGYSRHPDSLYRIFRRLGYSSNAPLPTKPYKPRKYHTPDQIGIKWQMDVKYAPSSCYAGTLPDRFYQYTVIDEASRQRFIYAYKEQSGYSSCDFLKRAIRYFGYAPKIVQIDNGQEFTHLADTGRIHAFDKLCSNPGIDHKKIRPRTPRHNGKVERSHRNDQERFYNFLHFYSYADLLAQMKRYLVRSNNIPMQVLGWLSPMQKRKQLESI